MKIFEMGSKPKNTDQARLDESFDILSDNLRIPTKRRSNSDYDKRSKQTNADDNDDNFNEIFQLVEDLSSKAMEKVSE